AAGGIDVGELHLAVALHEVDFLFLGAGDVEDGGGEGLFAEEALFLAVDDAVEFVEADHAAFVAAGDEDDVGLGDAVGLGEAALAVNVEVFDGDAAAVVGGGGLGIFAKQRGDIAVGLVDGGILVVVGEGDDDADGGGEVLEVGLGLGGEGVAAVFGEVVSPAVVDGQVVEAAEQGE